METPRPPEERNHIDKTIVAAQESLSSETNAKQALAIHSNSIPITNIDDVITELNSAESKEKDRSVLDSTDASAKTEECSEVDDRGTAAESQPNLLDFSALDVGNSACHFPVGKTFLNSYSRNFSNLGEDIVPLEKGHGEKPSMYSLEEDSDSESDSADSAVKVESSQGHCECPQDTDSDEEEVELCYSTVSQPAFSQSEGSSLPDRKAWPIARLLTVLLVEAYLLVWISTTLCHSQCKTRIRKRIILSLSYQIYFALKFQVMIS